MENENHLLEENYQQLTFIEKKFDQEKHLLNEDIQRLSKEFKELNEEILRSDQEIHFFEQWYRHSSMMIIFIDFLLVPMIFEMQLNRFYLIH